MSSGNQDLPYWLGFARCLKLGPTRFALLRKAFASMRHAWQASARELTQAGLEPSLAAVLIEHRQAIDLDASWQELAELGLEITTIEDQAYPNLLKQIFDPPAVLFSRGDMSILKTLCLAVVGSRQASNYGLTTTKKIVSELAPTGITIVSGLAYGIDTVAHQATLSVGGKTVAVMACGLDQIYPAANRQLAEKIIEHGGLWLSEFPPHTAPLKQNFPFRNRVIAGLAQGTIVMEAAKNSGALLTAKHALEANREIFALPGNTTTASAAGSNELLKQGAHLITSSSDVLSVFGITTQAAASLPPLDERLKSIFERLPAEPTQLDDLVRQLNLPASSLLADLSLLEIKGYVNDVGGHVYQKTS